MPSFVVAASAGICSGIKGPVRPSNDFRCAHCQGKACPIYGRRVKEVLVDDKKEKVWEAKEIQVLFDDDKKKALNGYCLSSESF